MKKISTAFIIEYNDNHKGKIQEEIRSENKWINDAGVIATRKYDGSACAIIKGVLYKRWDNKKGKKPPINSIECQEADKITGHHPYWVVCNRRDNSDKYFYEAFDLLTNKQDGTYELCGEKVQGNPERFIGHKLIKHGCDALEFVDFKFNTLKIFLCNKDNNLEGIVFHHPDGMMCKLRKCDFLVKR